MRRRRLFRGAAAALALAGAAPALAQTAVDATPASIVGIAPHVGEASRRFGIPDAWIYALIRVESAGRVRAVSSAGAMGLMQLMPGTWARQRARFALGSDPFDPRDNILAGTSYLREMHDRYGAPGFLAAYNAGPGRYEDWRDRGRALPAETRAYVAKLALMLRSGSAPAALADVSRLQPVRILWTQGALFSARGPAAKSSRARIAHAPTPSGDRPVAPPSSGLFVPVSSRQQR